MAAAKPRLIEPQLAEIFLQNICLLPGGEKIKQCLQCGTCGGSCPTSEAMDYTPREIIAAFRAGLLDRVLRSNTVWLCASCYSCTVRCPAGIKLTDIMYELKRLGIKYGIYPPGVKTPFLSTIFVRMVDKYGRNPEGELLTRYFLKADWRGMFKMLPLALKMWRRGRLRARAQRIKGQQELKQILHHIEKNYEEGVET